MKKCSFSYMAVGQHVTLHVPDSKCSHCGSDPGPVSIQATYQGHHVHKGTYDVFDIEAGWICGSCGMVINEYLNRCVPVSVCPMESETCIHQDK